MLRHFKLFIQTVSVSLAAFTWRSTSIWTPTQHLHRLHQAQSRDWLCNDCNELPSVLETYTLKHIFQLKTAAHVHRTPFSQSALPCVLTQPCGLGCYTEKCALTCLHRRRQIPKAVAISGLMMIVATARQCTERGTFTAQSKCPLV